MSNVSGNDSSSDAGPDTLVEDPCSPLTLSPNKDPTLTSHDLDSPESYALGRTESCYDDPDSPISNAKAVVPPAAAPIRNGISFNLNDTVGLDALSSASLSSPPPEPTHQQHLGVPPPAAMGTRRRPATNPIPQMLPRERTEGDTTVGSTPPSALPPLHRGERNSSCPPQPLLPQDDELGADGVGIPVPPPLPHNNYESIDYDRESSLEMMARVQLTPNFLRDTLLPWLLSLLTAAVVAVTNYAIVVSVKGMHDWKLETVQTAIDEHGTGRGMWWEVTFFAKDIFLLGDSQTYPTLF